MAARGFASQTSGLGTCISTAWSASPGRSFFGELMLVLFLLAQCFDGVLTYVGVKTFGITVEANPLISALMIEFGAGAALVAAKVTAGMLGIALHLREVHGAVAGLTFFYLAIAIAPWTAILLTTP